MTAVTTLNAALERAAEQWPDRMAFRFRDEELKFSDLEQRSRALAQALLRDGLQAGDRVGIHLGKGLESIVGVWGTLRAGGAWVPLDITLPAARLAFMLEDCAIDRVVTDPAGQERLEATGASPLRVFGPETGVAAWAALQDPVEMGLPDVAPDQIAYLMYTSGSTGEPKAICHTHGSGLAYARAAANEFHVTSEDRISGFPPLHFDQCTFHLYSGVLRGAACVLVPEEYGSFPVNLGRWLESERITIWYSVPFVLTLIATRGGLDALDLSRLRWVKFGGEAFPAKYLAAWMEAAPDAGFANIYGPAEVNQCTHQVVTRKPAEGEAIPIGTAWDAARLRVVDETDQPVAPGTAGELLVATETMMRGYWHRPDLDQKAFLDDPDVPGGRWYRTGDLVREGRDGVLDFLGRRDRQIKTRGFRVELDEVEAALLAHPGVGETAVYPVPGPDDSTLLEAAIIPTGEAPERAELYRHLHDRLARYAIPASFLFSTDFPRTGSGKIDRRALAESRCQPAETTS